VRPVTRRGDDEETHRQAGSLGESKGRVEMAVVQYLGPVHKLWEGGAKSGGAFDSGRGLLAKAKVSESPCARLQATTSLIRVGLSRGCHCRCWSCFWGAST
jgi:hypothetical protein